MGIYTKEEQFKLIQDNPLNLEKIDNQYEEVCLEAVKIDGEVLKYVKKQTPQICLEAIKESGWALMYVKEQTLELCLAAVKRCGIVLKYIEDQTSEICLEAVKDEGLSLEYVKEQTPQICLEAVKNKGEAIKIIKKITPEMCFYAFLNDYSLLSYKYIKTGIDKFIKGNFAIKDNIFCNGDYRYINKDYCYFDLQSLIYLKEYLLKENSNNKYILDDKSDIDILKEIAISDNELIIIDTGNIKEVHKILANRIIKKEDLEKESF